MLDVACGHGRIANRLAAEGASVTGIDRCAPFLVHAREDAAERGVDVDYREGDMRTLDFDGEFDVVVSWFTSFGYFDDLTNRDVLKRMFRATAPGGRLILETINRDLGKLSDEDSPFLKEVDGEFMIDQTRYDPLDGCLHVRRFVARHGERVRQLEYFVRLFTFTEIRDWLLDAGFAQVRGYGGEGEVLRVDSTRVVVVAERGEA